LKTALRETKGDHPSTENLVRYCAPGEPAGLGIELEHFVSVRNHLPAPLQPVVEVDAPSDQGRGTVTTTDVREARPDPSTHSTVTV